MTWKQKLAQIRQAYTDKVAQAKGILEAIKDNVLEEQERSQVDKLMSDAEAMLKTDEFKKLLEIEERSKRIDGAMREHGPDDGTIDDDEGNERRGAANRGNGGGGGGRQIRSAQPNQRGRADNRTPHRSGIDSDAYDEALGTMLRFGRNALDDEQRGLLRHDFTNGRDHSETRGTMTGVGIADGAALVSPIMADRLTEAMTVFTNLRDMGATIITSQSGAPMTFPVTDFTGNVAYEVGEGVVDSTEDSAAFGSIDIPTYECITPMQYVSRSLLNDSAFDILGYLQRKIALGFDALLSKRTVYGNGANQMRGLVWELCRDGHVVDSIGSTAFVDADFATLQAGVGDAYKFNPNCRFAFSPEFAANRFLKLAGSDGQYLYRQAANKPGQGINGQMWTLLTGMGDTVTLPTTPAGAVCSLAAVGSASTITAGRIVALFGDASLYVIRNINETLIERFEQETGAVQRRAVAFRGVRRIGGGWTSASTGAASRPMAALRIKS